MKWNNSKLEWDASGEHLYETGVKMGVLYPIVKNLNEPNIKDNGCFYKDYKIIEY